MLWWIVAVVAASVVVLWPLAKPGFFISDDGEWMIIRLSAFFQSFREGQFPVRFLGRLNHSYGYPVANFLYPGFLYGGSVIHALGFSFPDTVKILLAGSVVASSLIVFFWLRKHFSTQSSFVGTLGFLFSPYLAFDIYTRGSVGEVFALVAGAIGLYSIDARLRWLFFLSVSLLIVSHNSLAIIFLFLFIAYIAVQKASGFWLPLVLGIGGAAFFWFPALFERRFVQFDSVVVSNPADHFLRGERLMLLGLVHLVAALLVVWKKSSRVHTPTLRFFIGVLIAIVILSTPISSLVWNIETFVKVIQFPFRFLVLGLFVGGWFVAASMESVAKQYRMKLIFFYGILWIVSIWPILLRISPVERPEGYYTTNEATTTVANEYMPRWVRDTPTSRASTRIEFHQGQGTIVPTTLTTQRIDAILKAEQDSIVQINTIYYPGWGVSLDNQPLRINYQNPQGIMRLDIPAGTHRLIAEFRETVPRFLADVVSVFSVITAFVMILFEKKQSRTI